MSTSQECNERLLMIHKCEKDTWLGSSFYILLSTKSYSSIIIFNTVLEQAKRTYINDIIIPLLDINGHMFVNDWSQAFIWYHCCCLIWQLNGYVINSKKLLEVYKSVVNWSISVDSGAIQLSGVRFMKLNCSLFLD